MEAREDAKTQTMALHLITGGGGYLGSHLASRLMEGGHEVRILDLARSRTIPEGVEFVEGDVRDAAAVRRASEGVGAVHHLAFVQSMSRRPESFQREVAIDGTRNVLEAAATCGVRRFVFTSTIEVYGTRPPVSEECAVDEPRTVRVDPARRLL